MKKMGAHVLLFVRPILAEMVRKGQRPYSLQLRTHKQQTGRPEKRAGREEMVKMKTVCRMLPAVQFSCPVVAGDCPPSPAMHCQPPPRAL